VKRGAEGRGARSAKPGEKLRRRRRVSSLRASRVPPPRDMDVTPFAAILADLLDRIPGGYAAALVDRDGETVDYAGLANPFDVKIAAAHFRILLHSLESYGALGRPRWVTVRGAKKSVVTRQLPDGYALVLLLRRRAGFASSERAFATCARELAQEAGWPVEPGPSWYPLRVDVDRRGRPRRVGEGAVPVEVLGAIMGLPPRETGFRVRTARGGELTLVREARNCWYADERLAD